MKQPKASSSPRNAHTLRQRAEQKLRQEPLPPDHAVTTADLRALVHELQVHQIELEMQNEELVRARAEAEEAADKYTELFDFAPVGYFVLDARGVIHQANLAAAALLGVERKSLAGQSLSRHVAPEFAPAYAAFCKSLGADDTKRACELQLLKHGHGPCDVLVEGMAVAGSGLRLAVIDISARKHAEASLQLAHAELERRVEERTAELTQTNAELLSEIAQREAAEENLLVTAEELKRSNSDLEQFASIASHDMQEPLRAVNGYLTLLKRRLGDKLDPKAQGFLATALDGASRMEKMIGDLLGFSRVATQANPFAPADLGTLLSDVLENLSARIKSSGATITNDPLPRLSVDTHQITRLFQNLIANAIKFRSERPPRIHIGARQQPDRWEFWVRDNGIGIKPEYFDRIFQIFQRLHTQSQYPGTGMGLAICKRIVERHGGTIRVESTPGEGSTFHFWIPTHLGEGENAE